jgi:hypothetical protein
MKLILHSALLLCLFITACKKEENSQPVDHYNSYDQTIQADWNGIKSLDIDINKDGTADFKLTSELIASPGLGINPLAYITTLHSGAMLEVALTHDSLFLSEFGEAKYDSINHVTFIDSAYAYSCVKLHDTYHFDHFYQALRPVARYSISEAAVEGNYRSGKFYMNYFEEGGRREYTTSDTVVRTSYLMNIDACNPFSSNTACYVYISVNGKYGWIKLLVVNRNIITLLETNIAG